MTFDEFYQKYLPWHNHICILYDLSIVRLIGVGEDEHDLFYIVKYPDGRTQWASAVGALCSLNGIYDRYLHMENVLNMNQCKREDVFRKISQNL